MKKIVLLTLVLTFLPLSAHADLGDPEDGNGLVTLFIATEVTLHAAALVGGISCLVLEVGEGSRLRVGITEIVDGSLIALTYGLMSPFGEGLLMRSEIPYAVLSGAGVLLVARGIWVLVDDRIDSRKLPIVTPTVMGNGAGLVFSGSF